MGRRSLRKTDPNLDLSDYFLTFEEVPKPWDAAVLFGRDAPLIVEVGSGKGLFMATASENSPDRNHLGIELRGRYARYAAYCLAEKGLTAGKMLRADALRFFSEVLPDDCVDEVHVYFPDPWWKTRHHKRRVMNEPFICDIQRVLVPGGVLHFWTDVEEYFQNTLQLISKVSSLQGPIGVAEANAEHDFDYRTHFERRTRRHGKPVYRSQFLKK